MTILYIALPVALMLAVASVLAFIWSVRSGQLDDLDTPPVRMLFDDEPPSDHSTNTDSPEDDSPEDDSTGEDSTIEIG